MTTDQLKQHLLDQIAPLPQADIAVAYKSLPAGPCLFINATTMMHAASTMKVAVMMEVFKQAAAGNFALTNSIPVKNAFKSLIDGSLYALSAADDSDDSLYAHIGGHMVISDLINRMITVSSNLATNILMQLVGAENIMATLREMGASDMQVLRGVEDLKAYRTGKNNMACARDLLRIMAVIALKEVVNPAVCERMLAVLLQQKHRAILPALLPPSVRVAHKTGAIRGVNHDFGVVYPPDAPPYAVALMSQGIADRQRSDRLLAQISRVIYDFHTTCQPAE